MYRVALNTAIAQFKKDKKNVEEATPQMPIHTVEGETF